VSDEDFEKMVASGSFGGPPKRQPDKVIGPDDYGEWNEYIVSFRFFFSSAQNYHLVLQDRNMDLEPVHSQNQPHPDLMMVARDIEGLRRPLPHRT